MEVQSQFIEMFKNLPVNGVIKDLTVGNIASVKKSYSKEDIINYIDISSIDNTTKTIVETSEHLVTKAPSRAQQCVQKGDILVSTVRPINRNIAVIEKDTSHLVASTGFCILRPQEGYKEYLLSIVLSDTYTEKMYDKANGGLYPAVNNSDVLNYGIHIPDEDTAKKVSALYQQSDKSKFVGFKSQFIEMFGKGNWEQKCLGEIGTFKRGGGFQKSDYVEHGIPCIHYGQIHTKFGPFIYSHITEISTDLEPKTKFASKGDLIIAITSEDTEGSCKSTAWLGDYPVAVGGHAAIFHHCMNPLYMSFFFKSTLFNYAKMEYIHGTKVFEVKPDNIAKILVPCPPMSLQKQFSVIARQADKSKLLHRTSIKYSKYSL